MEANNVTQETLDLMKSALTTPSDSLRKSVTVGTGLVPFDLQAPAKNLYPVATPLRNVIPRVGGGVGSATNWKSIFSVSGSGYDSMGWVPEGQRAGRMSYSAVPKSASYKTLGEEDNMTFEAINAGKTFEDIIATGVVRILQKMMLKEENAIFGGNLSVALGTPATPTTAVAGTTGTLPTLTYDVAVVALTHEGYRNWIATGQVLATGLATSQTVTGADGATYVVKGGSSQKSAVATQAVTLGQILSVSTTAIPGAVAYGWYVGGAGAAKLEAVTTINSATFSAPLAGTGQTLASITADNSKNDLAFDGLLYTAINAYNAGGAGNGAYVKMMATGTAGTGTPLTASGRGSVVEIDDMLLSMWNNFQTSPTVLWVNAQEIKNITSKVLSNASGPLLRYNMPADGSGNQPYAIMANGVVEMYFNPYALNGGFKIPIKIHPLIPAGTVIGWSENLPAQYQNNETPNVAEMKIRADYYSLEWPIKTRAREYGVYAEEVLAVYAPFAMGVISNIGNG
jgi:hypothetical protein